MKNTIQFETPENVEVTYDIAGLGSRFVAWIEDQMILMLAMFLIFLGLLFLGMGSSWVGEYLAFDADPDDAALYFVGIATLVMGFANFLYFGLSELLMRGQTIGKKHAHIRVVKVNGYALDAGSVLVRSAFRVLDHIPIMWFVPLFTPKSQRLGDLVAGTLCISDEPKKLGTLREILLARPGAQRQFRFDVGALNRARASDKEAVERILENLGTMPDDKQEEILAMLSDALADRMQVQQPDPSMRRQFLEDFMAAEYRRQQRHLG